MFDNIDFWYSVIVRQECPIPHEFTCFKNGQNWKIKVFFNIEEKPDVVSVCLITHIQQNDRILNQQLLEEKYFDRFPCFNSDGIQKRKQLKLPFLVCFGAFWVTSTYKISSQAHSGLVVLNVAFLKYDYWLLLVLLMMPISKNLCTINCGNFIKLKLYHVG